MSATDIAAWYAAIVATSALGVQIWTAWRDRAQIVVTGQAGMRVTPGGPYDPQKEYILITVANRGRRPRTIEKVGLKVHSEDKPFLIAADSAIKGHVELREGQSDQWVVEQAQLSLDQVEYVWAIDATGKEFRGKLKVPTRS